MNWQERADAAEHQLRDLFLAALGGDAAAYERFLRAAAPHLRAFFRKRLFDRTDEVEDLVQETLLAIHIQRHTYQAGRPLTAWVHSIARYKLMDVLRVRYRRDALHEPLADEVDAFAESAGQAFESRHDLETLLETLAPRHRQALWMTKVEGASVAEAAAATGMSEVAVKVAVHRALRTLAAKFGGSA